MRRPHDSVRFRTNPQALLRKVRQSGRIHHHNLKKRMVQAFRFFHTQTRSAACGEALAQMTNPDKGPVAQSVEQRIENPCVGGSIPSQATNKPSFSNERRLLFLRSKELLHAEVLWFWPAASLLQITWLYGCVLDQSQRLESKEG